MRDLPARHDVHFNRGVIGSQAYARTFGTDERTIVGKTFAEVIGEAATREIRPRVDRVLHEGVTVTYERVLERVQHRLEQLGVIKPTEIPSC